jgi:putative copper export protein
MASMEENPEGGVKRRRLRQDILIGALILLGVSMFHWLPALRAPDALSLPSFEEMLIRFLVFCGIGLIIGIVLTSNYLEPNLVEPLLIRLRSAKYFIVLSAFTGVCLAIGSIVYDVCLRLRTNDVFGCYPISWNAQLMGMGLGIGVCAWIYNWASRLEKDRSGQLLVEVYSQRKRLKETLTIIGGGAFLLIIAAIIFYKIYTMK